MAKDTYYFSHDYNARNDRKIAALVKDYKSSGYGIFWATCELMHEEGGCLEFDQLTIDAIAKDMNEDSDLVSDILDHCVSKYKLFTKQNEAENCASMLHSGRVIRNLDGKNEKKQIKAESGRLGGIKSGESRRNKNESKQNEAERSTASQNEAKEIKGNKIKEKESIYNWDSDKKSFLNGGDWIFKFCTDKKISIDDFDLKAKEFLSDVELKEDFKPLKDLRSHFTNWFNLKNGKNGNGFHRQDLSEHQKREISQREKLKNAKPQ